MSPRPKPEPEPEPESEPKLKKSRIEEKPASSQSESESHQRGPGSRVKNRKTNDYPRDYYGNRITLEYLEEIGFWNEIPAWELEELEWSECNKQPPKEPDSDEWSDIDEDDMIGEPHKCLLCGQMVYHKTCPFLKFAPHGAILPPGTQRICKCCGERDGRNHKSKYGWKGRAVLKECSNCNTIGEHWTDEAVCPHNAAKNQQGSVSASASSAGDCSSRQFPPIE